MRIAIDSGGTFTDCVFVQRRQITNHKSRLTPRRPAEAIVEAVQLAASQPVTKKRDPRSRLRHNRRHQRFTRASRRPRRADNHRRL